MRTPNQPQYQRAIGRALFIVVLFTILLLPPLLSKHPRAEFRTLRQILEAVSISGYLVIGTVAALALLFMHLLKRSTTARHQRNTQTAKVDILWHMPIEQAVLAEQGGNGLASKPLTIPPLGMVQVHTPGMECVVLDGKQVIKRTRRVFSLSTTGMKARRVLLNPQPRMITGIKTLSHDQLETSISASIIFRVKDPSAALTEAPLTEFVSLVQGVIIEHIHSHDQSDLLHDRGSLRADLEDRLRKSKSLLGYSIIEVALLAADGDRRLIEIGTQTRLEEKRADLIQAQGLNRLQAEEYTLKIEQLRTQLTEWAKGQEHQRLMELEILRLNADNVQAVIGAVSAIAQQGNNPDSALAALQHLLVQQPKQSMPSQALELVSNQQEGNQQL